MGTECKNDDAARAAAAGGGSIGVVLLNLGTPETEEQIPGFIYRLLSDPYVMPLPWPFRQGLAAFISRMRSKKVTEHYRAIGTRSPLSSLTRAQVKALRGELGNGFVVRYAFRHSTPYAVEVLGSLAQEGVHRVIGLPAYPHYSRSTTASAVKDLGAASCITGVKLGLVNSYAGEPGYIEALAQLTIPLLTPDSHVIFSAHGLPLKAIKDGDPYLSEVATSVAVLSERLPTGTKYSLAFQSRVGRMKWTGPNLLDETERLAREGVRSLVVVPISFVCENLETLYELDIELAGFARERGIENFRRVPTVGCHPAFIAELARLVRAAVKKEGWEVTDGN
ncbi:MAG: ferrochelatase [Nanoarchaeota archaeon]|nr:ferrochelatase [Nanoarchaeota archaeon]